MSIRPTWLFSRKTMVALGALAVTLGFAAVPLAFAQETPNDDPPTRVGRVSLVEGNVSFHPSPTEPWASAVLNYPVAEKTAFWTEPGGRAEVEIGEARVRLDGGTELDIVQFDDHAITLSVPQGRIDMTLRGGREDETYLIETPRGDLTLRRDGSYRIVAGSPDTPTQLASFTGSASLATSGDPLVIGRNEEALIGPAEPLSISLATPSRDGFDTFADQRDGKIVASRAPRFVQTDMPGVTELDNYGTWRDTADYGHVWIPTSVPDNWAPYRYGHWSWVEPWGWTWLDDAPWGFAPFHYGRWIEIDHSWAWIPVHREPALVVVHPVYAPALVVFIDHAIDILAGARYRDPCVGWVVLGPNEVWHPYYHTSDTYVRNVNIVNVNKTVVNNITNVTNVTNVTNNNVTLINQKNVTVIPQQAFASASPVTKAALVTNPAITAKPLPVVAPAKLNSQPILPPPVPTATVAGPHAAMPTPPAPPLVNTRPSAGSVTATPPTAKLVNAPTANLPVGAPRPVIPAVLAQPSAAPPALPKPLPPPTSTVKEAIPAGPAPKVTTGTPAPQIQPQATPLNNAPAVNQPKPVPQTSPPPVIAPTAQPKPTPGLPAPTAITPPQRVPTPPPVVQPTPAPPQRTVQPQPTPGVPVPPAPALAPRPAPNVNRPLPSAPNQNPVPLDRRPGVQAPVVTPPPAPAVQQPRPVAPPPHIEPLRPVSPPPAVAIPHPVPQQQQAPHPQAAPQGTPQAPHPQPQQKPEKQEKPAAKQPEEPVGIKPNKL